MAVVHWPSKMNCPHLCLCLFSDIFLALDFGHFPCWRILELVPLFVNCGFGIQDCRCLEHKNRLLHKIVVTQRIKPLVSNVIFMIPLLSLFSALSGGFVGFNDACVSCFPLVGAQSAASLPVLSVVVRHARHGGFQRRFQLLSRIWT